MSGDGYRIDLDPNLTEVVDKLRDTMSDRTMVGKLGLDWSVVVERNGRTAAEIRRTVDDGLRVSFYGDAEEAPDA